jgi:hypothetical protein
MMIYPKDWSDLSKRYVSQREVTVVEEVLVAHDVTALARWVSEVHASLDGHWGDSHQGQPLPVTVDELYKYFVTALESRVKYVNRKRPVVNGNDNWYLPAPFAVVLSMIGIVEQESPVRRIVPKWNEELDHFILDYEEWLALGQRLRRIELDAEAKIILIHAIEKDRRGDERLMELIPQLDESGTVTATRHGTKEVDPIAGTTFLLLGLRPSFSVGPILTPLEQRLLPFFQPSAASEAIALAMSEAKGVSSR